MKSLYALPIFLMLAACATTHPTTEMDRELALKLADKTPVVVTAPAPIINVNNYNGGQSSRQPAQSEAVLYDQYLRETGQGSANDHANIREDVVKEVMANQSACSEIPVYNYDGQITGYKRKCFGSN